jgi:hypothetical protein
VCVVSLRASDRVRLHGLRASEVGVHVMSFGATARQVRLQQKHVTRRRGARAESIRVGDGLRAVDRLPTLGRGDRAETLAVLRVTDVRSEPLTAITDEEVSLEGFPGKPPAWLRAALCRMHACEEDATFVRIAFAFEQVALTPARLNAARRLARLSEVAVATALGVWSPEVLQWEEHGLVPARLVEPLARLCGVRADRLFCDDLPRNPEAVAAILRGEDSEPEQLLLGM